MCKTYIKIFNEEIASKLNAGGFPYVIQKINEGLTSYAFEKTPELMSALIGCLNGCYSEVPYVEDSSLSF